MEILNNFGFEWTLFIAQIVNFLIIFFVLKKFLYKPVLKLLKERRVTIAEGLKHAEESARLLEETVQKEEKILRDAQEKTKKLILDAKVQSEAMFKQSEEETKNKVDKMLTEARTQIKYETEAAQKKLEANVTKIAVSILEKSLSGLFGEKEQETIMKSALKKMSKAD